MGVESKIMEIAKILKYSAQDVAEMLGDEYFSLALGKATTFEDFKEIYQWAPKESQTKRTALEKVDTMVTDMLENATAIKDILRVCKKACYGTKSRSAAEKKLSEMCIAALNNTTTVEEAMKIHDDEVCQWNREENKKNALKRVLALCKTAEEIAKLHTENVEDFNNEATFERWLSLCVTAEEIKKILERFQIGKTGYDWRRGSNIEHIAKRKLDELYLKKLEIVSTREDAWQILHLANETSIKELAFKKCLSFCKTTEDIRELHKWTFSVDSRKAIALKLLEILS